jgi:CDP-4-dehydro-6-deoxyglucose reductase, E3
MTEKTAEKKPRPFSEFEAKVEKVEDLTPRVKGIRFVMPKGQRLVFKAGQFVQIVVPSPNATRRTSYSIASAPFHDDFFELCVTRVDGGLSSTYLHTLKPGDTVKAIAPFGRFVLPEPSPRDLVFIATGSGIAPFRSMIQELIHQKTPRKIYLVFGNRHEEDVIYRKEWEDLKRAHPNFHLRLTLSRPAGEWHGARGYVQDHLEGFVTGISAKDFYICGLVKMIQSVTDKLTKLGAPSDQIHYERYD